MSLSMIFTGLSAGTRLIAYIGFGLYLLFFASTPAPARDGWADRPLVCDPADLGVGTPELKLCQDWIGSVLQPNSTSRCCGESDAFIADAFKYNDAGEYVAVITRDYPAGTADDGEGGSMQLPATPLGTEIVIPKERLNRSFNGTADDPVGQRSASGSNPTGHGIVFMNPSSKTNTVYCYFAPNLAALPAPQYAEK